MAKRQRKADKRQTCRARVEGPAAPAGRHTSWPRPRPTRFDQPPPPRPPPRPPPPRGARLEPPRTRPSPAPPTRRPHHRPPRPSPPTCPRAGWISMLLLKRLLRNAVQPPGSRTHPPPSSSELVSPCLRSPAPIQRTSSCKNNSGWCEYVDLRLRGTNAPRHRRPGAVPPATGRVGSRHRPAADRHAAEEKKTRDLP